MEEPRPTAEPRQGTRQETRETNRLHGTADLPASAADLTPDDLRIESSEPFVGAWNQLVSTTNWEKGRIIHQWRDSLIEEGAPATAYSDEAWCRMVGGITSQHVGRLRRVYQRFGDTFEDYAGIYWSHFQAAMEWNDAEMWLEGAVQNGWSVSRMRAQRWEAQGADPSLKPSDRDIIAGEIDEDFESLSPQTADGKSKGDPFDEGQAGPRAEGPDFGDETDSGRRTRSDDDGDAVFADEGRQDAVDFVRPFENLGELPDDIAEAFEAYKLAIIRHRSDGWTEISQEDLLGSLDALKELARAPGGSESD